MKIAVLTDNFINLIGAYDFIVSQIMALQRVARKYNLDIYIFVPWQNLYKKYSGISKLFYKLKYEILKKDYILGKRSDIFSDITNVKFVSCSPENLDKTLRDLKIEFFFPHMNPYLFSLNIPSLGYIYDCQHKYYPEFFDRNVVKARDDFFSAMTEGGACIVNSQDTKNDLIKFFNAKPEDIFVLPFTPKSNPLYLQDYSFEIEKYHLPERYFLSSNQFWLHKDHPTLFKAFASLIEKKDFSDVELVCTGTMEEPRKPEYIQELKVLIKDLGIENKTHLLGRIPKHEQIQIMKNCRAVIQTTLFEGGCGGGSVWDACSLGIPVIMSDIPVNLEIAGKANEKFFEAKNSDDLEKKMQEMLQQEHVCLKNEEILKNSEEKLENLGDFIYNVASEIISRAK